MPERLNLGMLRQYTMGQPMHHRDKREERGEEEAYGRRVVMGHALPTWQRPLVWSEDQMISFIESAWRGLNLGTYSLNQLLDGSALDNLLIDGQQRMYAIERYLFDRFPVFGWRWSQVTETDRRIWEQTVSFGCYVTQSDDEDYLRSYYNLLNFGGTAHLESERA